MIDKFQLKDFFKRLIKFLFNPKLLLCLGVGWLITNGWSYIMFGIGTFFNIKWMLYVSGAYITFLWIPFTPEKIVTVIIAIWLLKTLFPDDQKTLAVLHRLKEKHKHKK